MTTTILKQNINKVISDIDDKNFLEAVYTIVSNKASEAVFELTDDLKQELDRRKKSHKNGTSKSYTWQSVKKAALQTKA
jgi:hypothetical protein